MPSTPELFRTCHIPPHARAPLIEILDAARRAADPDAAVRAAWTPPPGSVDLLAVGKAALGMARAAADLLATHLGRGLVVAPVDVVRAAPDDLRLTLRGADHPRSTPRNVEIAAEVEAFVRDARRPILFLLSGGASAYLPLPAESLTIDDLDSVYADLRRAGAPIRALNAVRKHCERLKGGRLAELSRVPLKTLVLSDVLGDPLDAIGSGPAAPDPTTYADALDALDRTGLSDRHAAVLEHLRAGARGSIPETPKPGAPVFARVTHRVIGSNRLAMAAAESRARQLGFRVSRRDGVEGEASQAGRALAQAARSAITDAGPACVLFGGETTVKIDAAAPPTRGGPSQEMALAASLELAGTPDAFGFAYSTDGIDGESDNAGAVFSGRTAELAAAKGVDAARALRAHDSARVFEALGDQFRTGDSGTNVNHLACVLIRPPRT